MNGTSGTSTPVVRSHQNTVASIVVMFFEWSSCSCTSSSRVHCWFATGCERCWTDYEWAELYVFLCLLFPPRFDSFEHSCYSWACALYWDRGGVSCSRAQAFIFPTICRNNLSIVVHHIQYHMQPIAKRTCESHQKVLMSLNNLSNNNLALPSYSNPRCHRQQHGRHHGAWWLTLPTSGYMCQYLLLLFYIYSPEKRKQKHADKERVISAKRNAC